jgi:hypothetical protein
MYGLFDGKGREYELYVYVVSEVRPRTLSTVVALVCFVDQVGPAPPVAAFQVVMYENVWVRIGVELPLKPTDRVAITGVFISDWQPMGLVKLGP